MLKGQPTISEIFTLPILGVLAIEIFRDRNNELYLLFIPFILVFMRLFLAQFQLPEKPHGFPNTEFRRWTSRCVGWNQIAAFILLLMEFGAVIAGGNSAPLDVGARRNAVFSIRLSEIRFAAILAVGRADVANQLSSQDIFQGWCSLCRVSRIGLTGAITAGQDFHDFPARRFLRLAWQQNLHDFRPFGQRYGQRLRSA